MLASSALMAARDGTELSAPDAPANHGATAQSSSRIDQSWDDLPAEESFEVERADDSDFTSGVVSDTLSADTTSKSWTGLDSSTTYYFRVRGVNAAGNGEWSTTVSETTDSEPTAPNAPSSNNATADGTSGIDQSWTDNSGDETSFEVQIALDPGFTSGLQTDTVGANVTSKDWSGLSENTEYFTRVRAKNSAGSSAWSNTASATTDATAPDGAPSSNSLSAVSASRLDQSWADNSSNEDEFEVQIALDSGFTSGVQTATVGAGVTSKSWTGLTEGTTYYSRVRASNSGGDSAWSNTDSTATKLAQPTGLTATQNGDPAPAIGFMRLEWSDNSSKEANYEVYKDGSLWATLSANTEQYDVDNGLNEGDWKVRAIHSTIPDSDFSNEVTFP